MLNSYLKAIGQVGSVVMDSVPHRSFSLDESVLYVSQTKTAVDITKKHKDFSPDLRRTHDAF
jgi:hypothetical protein